MTIFMVRIKHDGDEVVERGKLRISPVFRMALSPALRKIQKEYTFEIYSVFDEESNGGILKACFVAKKKFVGQTIVAHDWDTLRHLQAPSTSN
jgi:hypothetical protein